MKNQKSKKILAGNWKMFKDAKAVEEFFSHTSKFDPAGNFLQIVFPQNVLLAVAALKAKNSKIQIGAQNCHFDSEGAFTGENSVAAIKSVGASWVLIGHSERRQLFGETNDSTAKKVKRVLDAGLLPMLCVGETLAEREAKQTLDVVKNQTQAVLSVLSPEEKSKLVLAYEPVWAIGTGKVATPELAQEVHAFLRTLIGDSGSILYGGSVKPDNAKDLYAMPDIDGFLVGGASLKPADFESIKSVF
jgi:triosephosphate isomerase